MKITHYQLSLDLFGSTSMLWLASGSTDSPHTRSDTVVKPSLAGLDEPNVPDCFSDPQLVLANAVIMPLIPDRRDGLVHCGLAQAREV